jgi:hypothetical protein
MSKLVKSLGLLLACVVLTACGKYNFEESYRYPCQDPNKWEEEQCQSPHCDVWGGCPDQVLEGTRLVFEGLDETEEDTILVEEVEDEN